MTNCFNNISSNGVVGPINNPEPDDPVDVLYYCNNCECLFYHSYMEGEKFCPFCKSEDFAEFNNEPDPDRFRD